MQLYKLTDEFQEAVGNLNEAFAAGDLDERTLEDTMEALEGEMQDKCINVGLHIKNLRSDVDQLKNAKDEFALKQKRAQKQLDFYEYYLDHNMQKTGMKKAGNEYVDIKYRNLPDTVVCTAAPVEYSIVVPESSKPDKRKIKEALVNGESLSFATLLTGRQGLSVQ